MTIYSIEQLEIIGDFLEAVKEDFDFDADPAIRGLI